MSRKIVELINTDRLVNELRMEAEDLLNNMEFMDVVLFDKECKRISFEIDERIAILYKQYEQANS